MSVTAVVALPVLLSAEDPARSYDRDKRTKPGSPTLHSAVRNAEDLPSWANH